MSIPEKTAPGTDEDRTREYAVWGEAPHPVLLADAEATITWCNAAASWLLPDAAPGTAEGTLGRRSFAAHGPPRPDGGAVWWLVETTELRDAEEALRGERELTALLEQVSNALSASLNAERCTEVTARLAVAHLADAALVLARLFAARAGAALSAARVYAEQSAITTRLMRDLQPPTLSHHDGVEFAGGYRARGVPATALRPALDILTEGLHDFPRATALLAEGSRALTTAASDPAPAPTAAPGKPA